MQIGHLLPFLYCQHHTDVKIIDYPPA